MNSGPTRSKWPGLTLALALGFLLTPSIAHAHAGITSTGEIEAVTRPLLTPAHALILLALSLWLGQHDWKDLKIFMLVYAPLVGIALALTLTGFITEVPQAILVAIALALASLVAWEKAMPSPVAAVLFAVAGLALGFDSGVEGAISKKLLNVLFGTWTGLVIVPFTLSFYVSLCKKPWLKIGIRVLASWIIAISFLVLAFALKK